MNTDERTEVKIAAGNSWRSVSRSEIEYAQTNRQDNVPMAAGNSMREEQLPKQCDEKALSFSNSTRRLAASTPELRSIEHTNDATFSMQSLQKQMYSYGKCSMSSSMKADIHLGPNSKSNLEIYKNTKFEEIEYCFNISQKLVMEHSEVILNVKCLEHSSPSWARSVVKAKVCVFADSVLCVGQMRDTPEAIERWTSQVEGLKLYSSYQDAVESMERQLNSSEKFLQVFHRCPFFKKSSETWNDIEWKTNDENCTPNPEKIKNYAMKFSQGHWRFLGPGSEESGLKILHTLKQENLILQPTKWNSDLKKLVIVYSKSFSALSRGILKQEKIKEIIHFNGDSSNTELLFQTLHFMVGQQACESSHKMESGM